MPKTVSFTHPHPARRRHIILMMDARPQPRYLVPYREALEQHGPGFPATLWISREAQQLRFDVMIALIGMEELDEAVILDAGCATGDLAARLIERGVKFRNYLGIDAMPELISAARERKLERCEFHLADLVHDRSPLLEMPIVGDPADLDRAPDFIFFSGTLNTMEEEEARDLVSAAHDAARRGVIFNFLSDRASPHWMRRDIGPSRRFNTVAWLDWALSRTSLVSFSQEYLEGHDATILMRREPVAG